MDTTAAYSFVRFTVVAHPVDTSHAWWAIALAVVIVLVLIERWRAVVDDTCPVNHEDWVLGIHPWP